MKITPGHLWRGIGYGLTAAWMVGILVATGSDPAHPWFDYIFVVPLAGWIIGIALARLLGPRKVPPVEGPPRPRKK